MIVRVRVLGNSGAEVVQRFRGKQSTRFVPPDGDLSITEAATALKTNTMRITRLAAAGRLETRELNFAVRIPLAEIRRLKADPRALYLRKPAPR